MPPGAPRRPAPHAPPIRAATTGVLAVVGRFAAGPPDTPVLLTGADQIATTFGPPLPDGDAALALRLFFANGGERAYAVRVAPGPPPTTGATLLGSATNGTGLHALEVLEVLDAIDLLCMPDAARLAAAEAAQLYVDAARWCEQGSLFLLVDAPLAITDATGLLAWLATPGLRHRNAALYHPQVAVDGPDVADGVRMIGPSGAVAGVVARTDRTRGVWKAPAGVEADVRGVRGLGAVVPSGDPEQLGPGAVNLLREFPEHGPVVWGARTLAGDQAEDRESRYVPVQRTVEWVERSVARSLSWTAGEPNEAPLWHAVREQISAFLLECYRRGAFPGATPDEAFLVACGLGRTMTTTDIAARELVVDIGLALERPAEFRMLRIRHRLDGAAGEPPDGDDEQRPGDLDDDLASWAERLDTVLRIDALGLPARDREVLETIVGAAPDRAGQRDGARPPGPRLLLTGHAPARRRLVARALAGELGTEVVRLELDRLAAAAQRGTVTEGHLAAILGAAEDSDAVLLFDEADALFGRRTGATDPGAGHADRLAVLLRAHLADHPGLAVVAASRRAPLRRAGIVFAHHLRV